MSASLIKFAVAVLASAVITGCGGSSANNSSDQKSSDLPVAVTTFQSVDFSKVTDENLVNCINENGITHTGVQTLICADKNIQSLDGIEQFSNLRVINLSQNKIKNTQPLAQLKRLYSLDVSGNNLEVLSGFEELTALNKLNVNNNQLASADSLQELKNLKRLYISNNQLQSLAFVSYLGSLENLDAENNLHSSIPRLPAGIKTFSI